MFKGPSKGTYLLKDIRVPNAPPTYYIFDGALDFEVQGDTLG
jgi:hypothetical protein